MFGAVIVVVGGVAVVFVGRVNFVLCVQLPARKAIGVCNAGVTDMYRLNYLLNLSLRK